MAFLTGFGLESVKYPVEETRNAIPALFEQPPPIGRATWDGNAGLRQLKRTVVLKPQSSQVSW